MDDKIVKSIDLGDTYWQSNETEMWNIWKDMAAGLWHSAQIMITVLLMKAR